MASSTMTRRAAVLAYTLRSQEYGRRILRSLGYAPLVFAAANELMTLGGRASKLDMLYFGGHPPGRTEDDQAALRAVRAAVGAGVPVLFAPLDVLNPAAYRALVEGVIPASLQHFTDLYAAIRSLLEGRGIEIPPPCLSWNGYSFYPLRRQIVFADRQVELTPLEFDIALELFYNAGNVVTKTHVLQMLPAGFIWPMGVGVSTIIKRLRALLRLRSAHGWNLETLAYVGYRLIPAKKLSGRKLPRRQTKEPEGCFEDSLQLRVGPGMSRP